MISTTINKLDLSYNSLGGALKQIKGEPPIDEIADMIMQNNVQYLNISYNSIGAESMYTISYAIQYNAQLSYINISGNPIGNQGVTMALRAAKDNSNVKEVVTDNI